MLAKLKQDDAIHADTPGWRPTLVRSNLWDQISAPTAEWAEANPEKMMAFLMATQSDGILG